jgi:hypothetical protein
MYFKLLEIFILRTLFSRGEYNITSKNFNPIKFFTILILIGNVFFTVYLITKILDLHDKLTAECPSVFEKKEVSDKEKKEKS